MMISMTGFASRTAEDERATIGVTIRAVNHRYLDVQLRAAPEPRRDRDAAARVAAEAAGARAGGAERFASSCGSRLRLTCS